MSAKIDSIVRYLTRFHFKLVALHGKAPYIEGWNLDENLITTVDRALEHWGCLHPTDGVGVCVGPSDIVSLDADKLAPARDILALKGINIDKLIETTPTIVGRNPRLEFSAPDISLTRKAIVWPPKALGEKPVTVLEFRAGRVQDVLPPTFHPDTHRPYRWHTKPRHGFPPLPDRLLALWLDFDAFEKQALSLCPWPDPRPRRPAKPFRRKNSAPRQGPSVIAEFNAAHDAATLLESHGYERVSKDRWKSPNGHGVAGVTLLPDGKIYCHHTSDPLGDGKPHDCFDLYVTLEHGGNFSAAVRAAAKILGIGARDYGR